MKSAALSVLKFNAIMFLALLAFLFYAKQPHIQGPNAKAIGLLVVLLLTLAIGNIKIILNNRKEIIKSLKCGAVEAAAAAIEFKETASSRAQERIKEKINKN